MTLGLVFWIIMLLWLVLGVWWTWPSAPGPTPVTWAPLGSNLMLFVLFLLLGWHAFGAPIRG
jgi:hypothetical protein